MELNELKLRYWAWFFLPSLEDFDAVAAWPWSPTGLSSTHQQKYKKKQMKRGKKKVTEKFAVCWKRNERNIDSKT